MEVKAKKKKTRVKEWIYQSDVFMLKPAKFLIAIISKGFLILFRL